LAAGSGGEPNFSGAAPEADIVAVRLRKANPYYIDENQVPPDVSTIYSSDDFMTGVQYVLDIALDRNEPLCLCIGLGTNENGHDGLSNLDHFLSLIGSYPGVCVCVAAGNEAAAGHHTRKTLLDTGATETLTINIPNGVRMPLGFPIYIWNNYTDRLSVTIISPTGESFISNTSSSGTEYQHRFLLENTTAIISYTYPLSTNANQATWIKLINPSAGRWIFQVHGDIVNVGTFDAWLPISGTIDPAIRFEDPDPSVTITVPGTSKGVICVGAYDSRTSSLYYASSRGPTRLPSLAPQLVAPGVDVEGIYPDGAGTMSGTSAAAAITTGACALLMDWALQRGYASIFTTVALKSYLIRGCIQNAGEMYPNESWGNGRLNLPNTLFAMSKVTCPPASRIITAVIL
jgi:hypothetical protein